MTLTALQRRIYDSSDDSWLGRANWGDPLLTPEVTCEGVNECRGQGECVRPDTCQCYSGWEGDDCSQVGVQVFR